MIHFTALDSILTARHCALSVNDSVDKTNRAYYNAYLLSNFGIIVDKPELVTKDIVKAIADSYHLTVPSSFYTNPQDTKFFTKTELFIEQLVSYFVYESGNIDVARLEVFKKELPEYTVGDELVLRRFYILTSDELPEFLANVMKSYASYTRPWSLQEQDEIAYLVAHGYYDNSYIACKDNIIWMLLAKNFTVTPEIAKYLDKKDLVKMSVAMFGERSALADIKTEFPIELDVLCNCLAYVKDCALTKKQAKYFNKISKLCGKFSDETNTKSPYKAATLAINSGNVLEAAKIYAANGSLLERNLKFLLSRADPAEAVKILDMVSEKNPIVLFQLVTNLSADTDKPRSFTFIKNHRVKHHVETDYEARWRKSILDDSTKKLLHDTCLNKIDSYYDSLPKLGKIYINDAFNTIGLPANTSASGRGIDVLPTGSRINLSSTKIRSFCYWEDALDIDASLLLVTEDDQVKMVSFDNYPDEMDEAIRFSGDDRRSNGAEYYDLDLEILKSRGVKYVIQAINGFASKLNKGAIYAGYQAKDDFNTSVWDPKNIAFQFRVQGDSREVVNFAIDLDTNQLVILNLIAHSNSRTVSQTHVDISLKYLVPDFLELNIARIASKRGEIVDNPADADIIFDDTYVAKDNQTVIRTYDTEKLVSFVNN